VANKAEKEQMAAAKKVVAERKEQMAAAKMAKRANTSGYCEHGRRKRQCKECDTVQCQHRRQKGRCKDCSSLGLPYSLNRQ
jgi:hypothetical protein